MQKTDTVMRVLFGKLKLKIRKGFPLKKIRHLKEVSESGELLFVHSSFCSQILDNAWVLRRNAWKHLKLELHWYLYRSLFVSVVCLRSIKSFREDFIFVFLRKCRRRLSIIACCSERVTVVWSAILFFSVCGWDMTTCGGHCSFNECRLEKKSY